MIPTLIALFAVAFVTYLWTVRGFFSALLNMICVLVAGGIAFGLWEPIAYRMLEAAPNNVIGDSAWGLSLALTFGVVAVALRLAADKLVPHNAQAGTAMDYAGGAACGLVAAIISTGIMVMSLQYLRMPLTSWATYQAVTFTEQGTARGSLERSTAPFRPYVDELTAAFYTHLSRGTLSTPTPMAALQPDVHLVSTGMRLNYGEGKLGQSRSTIAPQDFELEKTYVVGDTQSGEPVGTDGITVDQQKPGIPQGYVDLKGNPVTRGYLAGYVVTFKAGAKESSGQIVIGNGQMSLVVKKDGADEWKTLFPIAAISQADSASADLGRWRFDADANFFASVGGASQATFAFEFLVPAGYSPTYFYVKNVRTDVRGEPDQSYATRSQRDRDIRTGGILRAPAGDVDERQIDRSQSTVVRLDPDSRSISQARDAGVAVSNSIGRTIQRGNHGGLSIEEHGRSWWVISGQHLFSKADVGTRITESSLRIDSLAVPEDTVVIKIDVSAGMPGSLVGQAAATANPSEPPVIVDSLGQRLQAVGWIYSDNERFDIRYTPGRPLSAVNDAPALSTSRPDQNMELIFQGNYGTEVRSFMIGNKEIVRFNPPIPLDRRQN